MLIDSYLILAQAQKTSSPTSGLLDMLIPMVLMFIVMYTILIKPQQRKQKMHEEMVNKLKVGDKVITSGGMHGTIAAVNKTTIFLKVADKTKIELNRSNISEVISGEEKETK